jgi:hypothetical protein
MPACIFTFSINRFVFMYKNVLFTAMCFLAVFFGRAQDNWTLKTNKEGIKIFTRRADDSKINVLKIECELPSTLSQLVAVILDIKSADQWQYKTDHFELIKQVSPSELYYYAESQFPWPASNRDYVSHVTVKQNPQTKTVSVDAVNVPDMVPIKSNKVRILNSVGKWTITPLKKNLIGVEYILQVDPGGSLPAAIINTFLSSGPFETFKKLKLQIAKPPYPSAAFPFIVN